MLLPPWIQVLQSSANKKQALELKPVHYFAVFLWLSGTFISAAYFIDQRLTEFDPDNKLSISHQLIAEEIQKIMGSKGVGLTKSIVHFTQKNCACTEFSEQHKQSIDSQAEQNSFNILNVELPLNYQGIIPSTPSIYIVDSHGKLLYLGPYSTGLACSQTNGLVEIVLANYAKGFNSDLVVEQSKGCYCNT